LSWRGDTFIGSHASRAWSYLFMVAEPWLRYHHGSGAAAPLPPVLGLRPRLGYTWYRRSLHYQVQSGRHTATTQHPHGNVGTRTPSRASVHGSGAVAPATFRRAILARTASLHVPWNPGLGNHVYAHAPLPPRTAKPRWDQCCCRPRTARDVKGDHEQPWSDPYFSGIFRNM